MVRFYDRAAQRSPNASYDRYRCATLTRVLDTRATSSGADELWQQNIDYAGILIYTGDAGDGSPHGALSVYAEGLFRCRGSHAQVRRTALQTALYVT